MSPEWRKSSAPEVVVNDFAGSRSRSRRPGWLLVVFEQLENSLLPVGTKLWFLLEGCDDSGLHVSKLFGYIGPMSFGDSVELTAEFFAFFQTGT